MPAPQLGFSQSLPCFCLKCPDSYPPLVPSDGRKFPVGEIARVQLRKLNLPYSGNLIWGYVAGISCNGGHHGGTIHRVTRLHRLQTQGQAQQAGAGTTIYLFPPAPVLSTAPASWFSGFLLCNLRNLWI